MNLDASNRRSLGLLTLLVVGLGGAIACSAGTPGPDGDAPSATEGPAAGAGAPSPPSPPSSVVPREFTCDPTAVTADTVLTTLPARSDATTSHTLLLRPSGAPCANELVVSSPAPGGEHVVSAEPGMIVLANATEVAESLVVCLSNERHSPSPSGAPHDRYSEAARIECAARTGGAWTPTVVAVPGAPDHAAWVTNVVPVAGTTDRVIVRWMRDSFFQFMHMVADGRPATDGVYETELTVTASGVLVGATMKVPGEMFETEARMGATP